MTEHKGLPVHGYQPQSQDAVTEVNENKVLEEHILRQLDSMRDAGPEAYDHRCIAIAQTKFQEAFMWLNRAVFRPARVKLPEDEQNG
jgi:hypothetical protein